MDKVPNEIIASIQKFIEEAKKDNIVISKAVLFGSYATGQYHQYSDIDLAVVSDDFQGIGFLDAQKMIKAVLRTNIDIETHPFRPEDFNEGNPFVREILQTGIAIS